MAEIRPFVSIRPQRGKAAEIAALPYDVYNREEATKEVERHPQSFLSIDRAETQFPLSVDMYDDKVYERAHDTLWQWVENGTFLTEDKKCYYLYELTMNGRVQTGVAACASIDDYENGIIKKHENTRAEKEVDRIRHVDVCNAQTGPIFLAYRANDGIRRIVEKTKRGEPEYDFTSEDGVRHRVFVIREDADIAAIHEAFAGIDSIYIADGHHRAASAVKVGQKRRKEHPGYTGEEEFNYFLSVLFPDDELMIMDYNRVVRDLNGMTPAEFVEALRTDFEVEKIGGEVYRPARLHNFAMYLDGAWYSLTAREGTYDDDDPIGVLDVTVLSNRVLDKLLDIKDLRTSKRIDFVGGIRGLGELRRRVDSGEMKVAFALYPVSMKQLIDIADTGNIMPPKTTWFEPKLRSGVVIHSFEEGK